MLSENFQSNMEDVLGNLLHNDTVELVYKGQKIQVIYIGYDETRESFVIEFTEGE